MNSSHPEMNIIPTVELRDGNRIIYMDPASILYKKRKIFLGLDVSDAYVNFGLVPSLLLLESEDPGKPIDLYINSPGGSITAGLGLLDTIRFIKSPVHTYCIGQAASMAAVILAAGAPGHRYSLPSARVLIHQPWSGGGGGQASDIALQAKEIVRLRDYLEADLAKTTGQSIDKIHNDCDRDFIMDANEAKAYGIVDHVISKRP